MTILQLTFVEPFICFPWLRMFTNPPNTWPQDPVSQLRADQMRRGTIKANLRDLFRQFCCVTVGDEAF